MKEYVVVHARRIDVDGAYDDVLLIRKERPAWQAGRLNLCGGKIEEGETPVEAAVRELREEAGLVPLDCQPKLYCGVICGEECPHKGGAFAVHCVRLDVDPYASRDIRPAEGETEKVEWFTFNEAWADDRLMPNLKVIVPMLHLGVTGWKIPDRTAYSEGIHEVGVQLALNKPFRNGES